MDCIKIQSQLTAYDDKELTEPERQEVEKHLAGCNTCTHTRVKLSQAWQALDELPVEEPNPFAWRRFVARLESKSNRQAFWRPFSYLATAAATLVLVVGINLSLHRSGPVGLRENPQLLALNRAAGSNSSSAFDSGDLASLGFDNSEEAGDFSEIAFEEYSSFLKEQ